MANEAKPCPCDIGDRMEYGGLGQEIQLEHTNAYVVKPKIASDKALIVIQDIYGWKLPNTRYIADLMSTNGYIAICPDYFAGKEPWRPTQDMSTFQAWLEDRKPTNVNKEVDAVLRYLKEQCGVKHIGAVGFCWGGVAIHYMALKYPEIKAGVSAYGSMYNSLTMWFGDLTMAGIVREREDRYELKSPTLFIFAEKDQIIPLDQVKVLEEKLKEKCTVDYQVKIFPGQTHGFVHRKREDINDTDKPCIQEARMDILNWFKKYM